MSSPTRTRKLVVVGAGPVGCLSALSWAKMGWDVDVYERRPDIRLPSSKAAATQRSINLAISSRGITALQAIDPQATTRFFDTVIPMRGRMIHDVNGVLHSQPYDRDGQCINSIDRALLNEGLLDEVTRVPNIRIFFRHKLVTADFDRRTMILHDTDANEERHVIFDLCIGADGSYSNVRRQMMRVVRMDFQQEYIPHEYIELKIPAGTDTSGNPAFLLDPNHLHIWPRHSFMLIALPNKDKTFTCTLFAPTVEFERLNTRPFISAWFKKHFPDALSLIGEKEILEDILRNPRSPLISIKAKPYHYMDRAVILGDAAHSMVPFYGQGLNCGLEDVRVLETLVLAEGVDPHTQDGDLTDERLRRALDRYSNNRYPDLVAICDLAMDNYVEMRHSVTTPAYIFRKALDNFLAVLSASLHRRQASDSSQLPSRLPFPSTAPSGWLPLYTMVTFRPDISYAAAKKKAERQSRIVSDVGRLALVCSLAAVASGLGWLYRTRVYRR